MDLMVRGATEAGLYRTWGRAEGPPQERGARSGTPGGMEQGAPQSRHWPTPGRIATNVKWGQERGEGTIFLEMRRAAEDLVKLVGW